MDEKATLRMFGEIARELTPTGNDHMNIRNFIKYGWPGIKFNSGLAIASKLSTLNIKLKLFKVFCLKFKGLNCF